MKRTQSEQPTTDLGPAVIVMTASYNLTISQMIDAVARTGDAAFLWTRDNDQIDWLDRSALGKSLAFLADTSTGKALAERYGDEHHRRRTQWLTRPRALTGFLATHHVEENGVSYWIEERLVRIGGDAKPDIYLGFLRNVTDVHAYQERLTYLACFDELTGHFTRARLRTSLAQSLVSSFADDRSFCFAFIGLDNMIGVNHAFGYDVADEVLTGVGYRIQSELGDDEAIGRVASSKFGVILDTTTREEAQERLCALQRIIRDEFILTGSGPVAVTVSIGAVDLPDQARTTQDAFAAAEDALTVAKQTAPGGFAFHKPDDTEVESRRRNIAVADELSSALREDRICLAFQPIVSAKDTSKVVFYESLARMVDRNGELVPAASFMPVAEQLGFVRLIDQRVLELAFDVLVSDPSLRLSINLSPQTMNDTGWSRSFDALTTAHPEAARRLIIEITESYAIQDTTRAVDRLAEFKARGCSIALDDFGAGYTSFKYFKTLNLDIVKIDGSYIRGVCDSPDNQLFVRCLSELALHYGMVVVAEMVEHDASAALLRGVGVECFQGNFFGPAEVVDAGTLQRSCG